VVPWGDRSTPAWTDASDILAELRQQEKKASGVSMPTPAFLYSPCVIFPPILTRASTQQAQIDHPIAMPQETEIKLYLSNPKSFLTKLKRLGAKLFVPRLQETNLLFDTPDGGLAKHGQLLRIRTETPAPTGKKPNPKSPKRHLLTFKSPPESLAMGAKASDFHPSRYSPANRRFKIREETELDITDAAALQKIFEGLGLRGWFRYEKYRTTFKLPARTKWANNLLIEIDETPIGTYVELEGPADAIDRAAEELGFSHTDYIQKNYLLLYVDDCKRRGQQPTHMLFSPAR
jgi:adenylate cyclase class 2